MESLWLETGRFCVVNHSRQLFTGIERNRSMFVCIDRCSLTGSLDFVSLYSCG